MPDEAWPAWLERRGITFRRLLLAILGALLAVVWYDDSDGFTVHDFLDTTQFHHEHIAIVLLVLIAVVALWPGRVEASYDSVFGDNAGIAGIVFVLGLVLVVAALVNLPDNSRVFGQAGVQGKTAALAGQVLNDTGLRIPVAGAAVNWTSTAANATSSGMVTTDANGTFSVFVPVGPYALRLVKPGFQSETVTVNVLPSRGAHIVIYLAPTATAPPPPPLLNTNATNTPAPPAPATWFSSPASTCLYYTTHAAGNGSTYLSCVVKVGPVSSVVFVVGDLLLLAGAMIGLAYGSEQGSLGDELDLLLAALAVAFLVSRYLVPQWMSSLMPLVLFASWYVTLFGLTQAALPRLMSQDRWEPRHVVLGLAIVAVVWALGIVLYFPGTTSAVLLQGASPASLPPYQVSTEAQLTAGLFATALPGLGTLSTNALIGIVLVASAIAALVLWTEGYLKDEAVPKVSVAAIVAGALIGILPIPIPPASGFSGVGVLAYAVAPVLLVLLGILLVRSADLGVTQAAPG